MKTHADQRCFVVMPFTVKDFDKGRYDDSNHWTEVYRGLIEPAVKAVGMQCARDDGDIGSRLIVEGILKKIEESDLVLCDLSSHNPNVFLELGWALRADRPFVLIKDELTQFTFDLNQQYTFQYSHRLQPTVLSGEIRDLSDVIKRTMSDQDSRYSVMKHMGVSAKAILEASQGDYQTQMLLDIQRKVESLGRRGTAPAAAPFQADEWPRLMRKATDLLFKTEQYLRSPESLSPEAPAFIPRFAAKTREWEACRAQDIQVSVLDEQRRFIYHDWHEMIGERAYYQGQDSTDIYDDVFKYRFGTVVWLDATSNLPETMVVTRMFRRFNIGLFCEVAQSRLRIVVETHQEHP